MNLIKLVEVGPRDGLQNYNKKILSPQIKALYINHLQNSGLKSIEVGSFVSSKVKQMKNTPEVMQLIDKKDNIKYIGLIANKHFAQSALNCGVNEFAIFTTICEDFCQKNNGCNIDDNFNKIKEIVEFAKLNSIPVRAYISCVFGSPYHEYKNNEILLTSITAKKLYDLGCYEISLGDTIGSARPYIVADTIKHIKKYVNVNKLAIHLHNPHNDCNIVLSNLITALRSGIKIVDCATGNIGGCTSFKNSSINISTEMVVDMLNKLNLNHDVDSNKLKIAANFINEEL